MLASLFIQRAFVRAALAAAMVTTLLACRAHAQNVDLVTLPKRDTVQLTIYNSEDLTLAKETRYVTLKKGANRLQFSWAGTLIDPTSVEMRPLANAGEIEVADTLFPGSKPQHLIWNIESKIEGQVPIEVSYFTSGLTWQMDYVATANPDETSLKLRGHVRVHNNSGEEYENAHIRLIVGKINLVEKIADLARRQGIAPPAAKSSEYAAMKRDAAGQSFANAAKAASASPDGASAPKAIVKEGVSEYFMFSVEGGESISNGWSKRMPAANADDVAFDIVYRLREHQYGPRPVRFFIWKNDKEHKLGDSPLPDGVVRLFRENGRDGLSFLGQQNVEYVPIGADIEVNTGTDDLVVYERRKAATTRDNFAFNASTQVTGWNEAQRWADVVRNFRATAIRFELRQQVSGDVEYRPTTDATAFDYQTVETRLRVPARGKTDLPYTMTIRHGSNAMQNHVQILADR